MTVQSFFSLYSGRGGQEDKIGIESLHDMLVSMGADPKHIKVPKSLCCTAAPHLTCKSRQAVHAVGHNIMNKEC